MSERDIERVLIEPSAIRARVVELAGEISAGLAPGPVTAVGVLTGAFVFLADLVREMKIPVEVHFLRASSYRDGARPEELEIGWVGVPPPPGRDILIVEDILDTGRSLVAILAEVEKLEPRSLRAVVLLDKEERREVEVTPDYTGFPVPDEFLVGYGLDFAGRYRELPFVGILAREVYEGPS